MEVDEVEEVEPAEVPEDSEPAASDGEGDEEEYEIEGILDAKKGAFPQVMWSLARFLRGKLSSARHVAYTCSREEQDISSNGRAMARKRTAGSMKRTLGAPEYQQACQGPHPLIQERYRSYRRILAKGQEGKAEREEIFGPKTKDTTQIGPSRQGRQR
jgi:hypothetical protein